MPDTHRLDALRALLAACRDALNEAERQTRRLRELLADMEALLDQSGADQPSGVAANPPEGSGPRVFVATPEPTADTLLTPNGILATTGKPLLTLDLASAGTIIRAQIPPKKQDTPLYAFHHLRSISDRDPTMGTAFGDANDLAQTGWAIVVHEDESAALLRALSPLIEKRCADQDIPAPPLEFSGDETCGQWLQRQVGNVNEAYRRGVPVLLYRSGEPASDWLARHGTAHGPVVARQGVPFYLLMLGRPGSPRADDRCSIPFSFQYEIDLFWGVGRLCFTDPATGEHLLDDYRSYAEQTVAFERAATKSNRQIAYFATSHPNDRATALSLAELVTPLAEGYHGGPGLAARLNFSQISFCADGATQARLHDILCRSASRPPPSILFTATHGAGFLAGDSRLPAYQGALICQDWPGEGALKRKHFFAGEDLVAEANVQGLIAVCFACYSAGCPLCDDFIRLRGSAPWAIAPYPLVAQFPQRLLAKGALAVLGHVDRAWSYSFRTAQAPAQVQRFEAVLGRIMAGDRLGHATDALNAMQGALAMQLANLLDDVAAGLRISDAEISALWVARNDARNYTLLGDPAVRLQL